MELWQGTIYPLGTHNWTLAFTTVLAFDAEMYNLAAKSQCYKSGNR